MPPKSSSSTGNMPSEDDEPLQAVILADTYNERLKPLTVNQPRCLLPICNTTLLDWTLESLALAGVQEVFVVCTAHAELIKETLAASKWARAGSGLTLTPIATGAACFAAGEALRDVYTRGVVTADFVLVFGDLVSNVRLDAVVRAHRARRRADKDALMTVVVRPAGAEHRSRPLGDTGVFVLDADTAECVHYEAAAGAPAKRSVRIPRAALAGRRAVDVRNDLVDCGIDICSVEVPSLFQDNFDYLDVRRDFVRGVLTSDLLAKTIHCHVLADGYAARVRDTKSYAMISKDILARWTYPLVPDENNPGGDAYQHRRGNTYIPRDGTSVSLSRSCKVGPNTMIGAETVVESGAQVVRSVVGRGCVVGAGAVVRDSYLWDAVSIGAGCVVEHSIVGRGATLRAGSVLARGCVVGDGVVLGPDARLPEFARVARAGPGRGAGAGECEWLRGAVLGAEAEGVLWPPRGAAAGDGSDDEDELEDELETAQNLALLRIGDETRLADIERQEPESSSSEDESSSDDDDDDGVSATSSGAGGFAAQLGSRAEAEFAGEVRASLERAWAEGHTVENAAVELKTLRMASNVALRRVREAVVAFLVGKIGAGGGGGDARLRVRGVLARWGALITEIGGADGVETVEILQRVCAGDAAHEGLFGPLLGALYEEDIVDEADVRAWHALPGSGGAGAATAALGAALGRSWGVGARMIAQLDAQDTESESE